MKRVHAVMVGGIFALASLSACSATQPQPEAPASAAPTKAEASSPATSSKPSSSPSAAQSVPASSGTTIELNQTITDDVMGVKVTFVKAIRGLKPLSKAVADRELVLVEVKIDNTAAKYVGSYDSGSFHWGVEGQQYKGQGGESPDQNAWAKTNGYQLLQDAPVRAGKSGGAWIMGIISIPNSPQAYVEFYRLAATTSDGKSIPAASWKVPLGK